METFPQGSSPVMVRSVACSRDWEEACGWNSSEPGARVKAEK